MAILIITESCAESRTLKKALGSATLDALKAFDVVNQLKLKSKLFHSDLRKCIWSLLDSMYTGGSERFKLNNKFSQPYSVIIGVKQGGGSSPTLYKTYISELLEILAKHNIGLKIGTIYLGTPTVADDILLLDNEGHMQGMLDICYSYSGDHDYLFQLLKSSFTPLHSPHPTKDTQPNLKLGNEQLPVKDSFEHLGLEWRAGKSYPNIDKCISSARRMSYKLMGVGFHGGKNGLDPFCCIKIIHIYIVPKLLHGLNAAVLPKQEIEKMERFYRKTMKMVTGLSDSTANEAVYMITGTIPLEAHLHLRILSLFGRIARLGNEHPLYQLAKRQLLMTDSKSSWFTQLSKLAEMYEIDLDLFMYKPMKKEEWKRYCKTTVEAKWRAQLRLHEKSSLKELVCPQQMTAHGSILACKGKPEHAIPTRIRLRMLTGRYSTQTSIWNRNKGVNPACQLCGAPEENLRHLLTECEELNDQDIQEMKDELTEIFRRERLSVPSNKIEEMSLYLNGGSFFCGVDKVEIRDSQSALDAHRKASSLCYKIHDKRKRKIEEKKLEETRS